MKVFIVFFIIFFSSSVRADVRPWMKQNDPDRLGLFVGVSSDCPFSKEDIENRVKGEFLRARLKPTSSLTLNLTVSVSCMPLKTEHGSQTGYAMNYDVRYGTTLPGDVYMLYEFPNYGSLASAGKDGNARMFFINAITEKVSLALTDYLKANFE